MPDYGKWTIEKLKNELKQRRATTKGRKEDLVHRLESYDRNDDFRGDRVILPEEVLPNWPSFGFHQLVPDHRHLLPKLSEGQIETYLNHRAAVDKLCTSDLKSIEKGKLLFESQRIDACSIFLSLEDIYFTGIVRAAMKKKVSYNFKLRLTTQTGQVINSHCECPAGKGPHSTCKHVACVLLMLQAFIAGSDVPVVNRTCTENLQTFHKPAHSHDGSPIKAENLPCTRKPSLSDPRPVTFRDPLSFQSNVRSHIINYCAKTNKDITLKYLYPKADIQTAAEDHHYLSLPLTEYWVDNSLSVTTESAKLLEINTRQQAQCPLWHSERKWRITASRFGEICHATERRNTQKLCESIVFPIPLTAPPIIHGKQYESVAVNKFECLFNLDVKKCGLYVMPKLPFLGASPDGIVDTTSILEIKCPYTGRNSEIIPGKLFPFLEYDSDGAIVLKKSSNYYCQVQGQMYISGSNLCYFVVYTHQDLVVLKIDLDTEVFLEYMLPKLETFYTTYLRPYIAGNF